MPLKPCLKASKTCPPEQTSLVANSHPPIPDPSSHLPRTSSYIDYSTLPYSQVYVHFPPSPTLTSTHIVDPPRLYDRSPIVVSENSCAMPQRGCPGRTYATVDGVVRGVPTVAPPPSNFSSQPQYPKYYIPNTILPTAAVPGLIPDEPGSSSDDSDTIVLPMSDMLAPSSTQDRRGLCHATCTPAHHSHLCRAMTRRDAESSNHFLPHPPVSPRTNRSSTVGQRRSSPESSRIFTPSWDSPDSCLEGF